MISSNWVTPHPVVTPEAEAAGVVSAVPAASFDFHQQWLGMAQLIHTVVLIYIQYMDNPSLAAARFIIDIYIYYIYIDRYGWWF